MSQRRRAGRRLRLATLIVILLLCMWLLYRVFLAIPPAPAPEVVPALAMPACALA